jgi:hypothetical protein
MRIGARVAWGVVLGTVVLAAELSAQRGYPTEIANVAYDGRFVYARIKFDPPDLSGGFGRRFDPLWNHDYPRSDRTFPQILAELTTMKTRTDASNVFTFDDPRLHKFPVAYLCEVGGWVPNEAEALGMRSYLLKGGFVIVDDFRGANSLANFDAQLQKVLPGARRLPLETAHPLFNAFYRIDELPGNDDAFGRGGSAEFYGIFEDNDPTRRLLMVVHYNYDISELWEWSFEGRNPLPTGDAFKLGINYVIYTYTH